MSSLRRTVLVLSPDFPPAVGGIQSLAAGIARNLTSWQVQVVALPTETHKATCASAGGRYSIRRPSRVFNRMGRRANLVLYNCYAFVQVAFQRPDVVLCMHIMASPAALAAQRILGVPFVQYLHGDEVAHRRWWARFAVRGATAAIAVSDYTRHLVQDRLLQSRIHVIPPGVDIGLLPPPISRAPRPTILTVATLERTYKGHDTVLAALTVIRERVPNIVWRVVGDGPLRAGLEQQCRQQGLASAVEFLGTVDDDCLHGLYWSSWLFVMPSRIGPAGETEGFGMVFTEAAAHGLPAVAGDRGGNVDAILHGKTGLLVDATRPPEVAAAIVELLTKPDLLSAYSAEARRHAQGFDWVNIARRISDLLAQAATR